MNEPCCICGTYETWIKPNGKEISRKIDGKTACNNCYLRDWENKHPQRMKLKNQRRIRFKGERKILNKNPRTGICSRCGKSVEKGEINVTQMHHTEYDDSNLLANTEELCPSCHRKEHWESKKMVAV